MRPRFVNLSGSTVRYGRVAVALLVASFPIYLLLGTPESAASELDGASLLRFFLFCSPALIYAAVVRTTWGTIIVGSLLLALTILIWVAYSSDKDNPFIGFVVWIGLIPLGATALFGAAGDLLYRSFEEPTGQKKVE